VLAHLLQFVASGMSFACTPVAVWDGDGPIWCAEGPKIRLHGIAAREIKRVGGRIVDAGCVRGHPCPTTSGVVARDRLVRLLDGPKGTLPTGHVRVAGPTMTCRAFGSAKGSRTAAVCTAPGVGDLSCRLVQAGVVVRWGRYGGAEVCG
jgi:endonuclease YncB( thermonuclease family)